MPYETHRPHVTLPRETFFRIRQDDTALGRWRRHGDTRDLQRVIDQLGPSEPPRSVRTADWDIIAMLVIGLAFSSFAIYGLVVAIGGR